MAQRPVGRSCIGRYMEDVPRHPARSTGSVVKPLYSGVHRGERSGRVVPKMLQFSESSAGETDRIENASSRATIDLYKCGLAQISYLKLMSLVLSVMVKEI